MTARILYVEDEPQLCALLVRMTRRAGYEARGTETGSAGLAEFKAWRPDAVVLDLVLPDASGLEVLRNIKAEAPEVPVLMLTAFADVATAVAAMKAGAHDYLTKPVQFSELRLMLERALGAPARQAELRATRPAPASGRARLVSESPATQRVMELVQRVAPTDSTVLLLGQTGVGKGVIAREIHDRSRRAGSPFVAVNCAAIPEQLLESELFGYRRGAFTGAAEDSPGKFGAADGGTIFLDEIAELNLALQAKLLHVVQERTFTPLGSHTVKSVNVRIIAATNRNLPEEIRVGRFREDLYFRLNIVGITVPPLQARREDIPELAEGVLDRFAPQLGKRCCLEADALAVLHAYGWPGNVRELENVLQRAALMCNGTRITVADLPPELLRAPAAPEDYPLDKRTLPQVVDELEAQHIRAALRACSGNQSQAASLLGIPRQTLVYKMRRLGLGAEGEAG